MHQTLQDHMFDVKGAGYILAGIVLFVFIFFWRELLFILFTLVEFPNCKLFDDQCFNSRPDLSNEFSQHINCKEFPFPVCIFCLMQPIY